MDRVGIRELKQRASEVVRRVAAGDEIEITDRGRPVARMMPLPAPDEYERLVRDGEILPAQGRWQAIEPAAPLPHRTLSAVLEELREEDDH